MLRLPGKLLGVLFLAALAAHAARLAPAAWTGSIAPLAKLGGTALQLLGACVLGRVLLAWLPPGDVGGHAPRALAATAATSLALGLSWSARLAGGGYTLAGLVAAALLARLATLPAAMVPRHGVPSAPPGPLDALLALATALWAAVLFLRGESRASLSWLAAFVLLHHALGVARRRRAGRGALLVLGAFAPVVAVEGAFPAALALALGAGALVPWLRRADRRAGALSALGFGSLFLNGAEPLAVAGALVLVGASRPRQRPYALAWLGAVAALALAAAHLGPGTPLAARGRPLFGDVLRERALEPESWGLAWPLAGAALFLGALAFDWRARPWSPGEIEPPRREALALLALLALACVALALPLSPWSEEEALVIAFPLVALLAGLLLIAPEAPPESAR